MSFYAAKKANVKVNEDPEKWGPHAWNTIQGFASLPAFKGTVSISGIHLFGRLLMCEACRDNFALYLKMHPLTRQWNVSSRQVRKWLCQSHNDVNKRLGKPAFACQRALSTVEFGSPGWTESFLTYLYYLFGHYDPAYEDLNRQLIHVFVQLLNTHRSSRLLGSHLSRTFLKAPERDASTWRDAVCLIESLCSIESRLKNLRGKTLLIQRMSMVRDGLVIAEPASVASRKKSIISSTCAQTCSVKKPI